VLSGYTTAESIFLSTPENECEGLSYALLNNKTIRTYSDSEAYLWKASTVTFDYIVRVWGNSNTRRLSPNLLPNFERPLLEQRKTTIIATGISFEALCHTIK
jgi:hypothetical protein